MISKYGHTIPRYVFLYLTFDVTFRRITCVGKRYSKPADHNRLLTDQGLLFAFGEYE